MSSELRGDLNQFLVLNDTLSNTYMDKGERVSHTVTLLKKLIKVGIPQTDSGYSLIKKALDKWIADGEPLESQIEFARYGRVGHLSLFADKSPSFVLKATEELKRHAEEEDLASQ